MEKYANKLIDHAVCKVDRYVNNGSTWLIFTEDKKWVIELTKEGTLWYNYNFFKTLFRFLDLDVVENQHYITKWVEDNIINGVKHLRHRKGADDSRAENIIQNGVKEARPMEGWVNSQKIVDKTIQNGVKETELHKGNRPLVINDTIQNGVKETHSGCDLLIDDSIEDTIKNGVKHTQLAVLSPKSVVEDTIQNGVKYTSWHEPLLLGTKVEDTLKNGVKHTIDTTHHKNKLVEDTLKNGVKETKIGSIYPQKYVEKIMQNAVKKTYSDKIPHEYDWSKQFTEEIDDIIENGVKHTEKSLQIDGSCVIEDVVKNGIKETHDDVYHHKGRIEGVIKNSTKLN